MTARENDGGISTHNNLMLTTKTVSNNLDSLNHTFERATSFLSTVLYLPVGLDCDLQGEEGEKKQTANVFTN